MEEHLNRILLGSCLDVLKTLPDDSLDSFISDIPYGLGKEPSPDQILAYLQGANLITGDFMGKAWEIPSIATWREVYRVLKPGAYAAVFGGTRTFDLISMGLRMVGFCYRDTISDNFPAYMGVPPGFEGLPLVVELPVLQWQYGSGMPKSHNVGKAIDRSKGLKRTRVVGIKPGHAEFANRGNNSSVVALAKTGTHAEGFSRPWMQDSNQVEAYHQQFAPESEEATQWEGWGTGLKPSWEPILLFRKPFKGSLAQNVLQRGTGALNIDATRVKHASQEDFENHKKQVDAVKVKGGVRGNSWKNSSDLSGAEDVKEAGRWPANLVLEHSPFCTHDDSGWTCVAGCPAAELDLRVGERRSMLTGRADSSKSHDHPGIEMNSNSTFLGERTHLSTVYADSGGPSRFFSQFDGVPFHYSSKANRREAGMGEFKVEHPTVKPLQLMRWLVRLVTPPGGVVLDAYCGSGTTCHAAYVEGMQYIGIERDPASWEEAVRRLKLVDQVEGEERHAREMFEMMMADEDPSM